MTEDLFDEAKVFFQPGIELRPVQAEERRQRYSWPPLRLVAVGVLAASTFVVFLKGEATGTDMGRMVRPPRPATDLAETRRCLEEVKEKAPALPGIEAPNAAAFTGASRIVKALETAKAPAPERVVPDSAGGISFMFFGGAPLQGGSRPRYAALTATNDGEITALTHDRLAGATDTWSVRGSRAQQDAIVRIRAFLNL